MSDRDDGQAEYEDLAILFAPYIAAASVSLKACGHPECAAEMVFEQMMPTFHDNPNIDVPQMVSMAAVLVTEMARLVVGPLETWARHAR